MDFDYLIPDWHRILFHNLIFVAVLTILVYLILGKLESFISLYYLLSHLILDLGEPGIPFFYPFYKYLIGIKALISKPLIGQFNFDFGFIITPIERVTRYSPSAFLKTEGIILLLLISSAIFIYYLTKMGGKNRKK